MSGLAFKKLADGLIIVRKRNHSFPARNLLRLVDITRINPSDRCPLSRFTSFVISPDFSVPE